MRHQTPIHRSSSPPPFDTALPSAPQLARTSSFTNKLLLLVWFAYIVASPFYLFQSGYPQPADLIMVIFAAIILSGFVFPVPSYYWLYFFGLLFIMVVAIVNLVWWSLYYQDIFILSILFYIYNFTVLLCTAIMARNLPAQFARTTVYALLICVIVEVISIAAFSSSGSERATGTFNNPNQLGYWSLLAFAVWLVSKRDEALGMIDTFVAVLLAYVAIGSLSKAAIIGFLMMAIAAVILQRFQRSWLLGSAMIAVLLIGVSSITPKVMSGFYDQADSFVSEGIGAKLIKRLKNISGEQDSTAAGRGYDRLWLYPEFLLVGAGEGAFQRFATSTHQKEMHSTWGTILFSYGVTGMVAFLAVLFNVFRDAPIRHAIYFLPIAAYGMTHQGLRFSLLWVFFGLVLGLAQATTAGRGAAVDSA